MNVLVAIEGCQAHADRWPVIQETWGKDTGSAYMQFFTGARLNVPDDYLSLPMKTRAICTWAKEHDTDFLAIVDTDAYFSIPRFLNSGFEKYDYSGFVQTWLPVPYCSGPSYVLSRNAIQKLVETNWKQFEVPGHATDEDVMVGSVLFHRGIRYHHDERYVNPAGVLPDNNVISEHLTFHGAYTHERMREAHRRASDGSLP